MTNELVIVTNFVSRDITGLEVVGKVNELYASTFTSLLTMIGIVVGFGGVLLPYLFRLQQKRENRIQEAQLEVTVKAKLDELATSLRSELTAAIVKEKERLESSIKEAEERVEKKAEVARGQAFHNQAMFFHGKELFPMAVKSAIFAAEIFLENDALNMFQKSLLAIKFPLQRVTAEDFKEDEGLASRLDDFFKTVDETDTDKIFYDSIEELKKAKKEAMARTSTTKDK